MDRNAMEMFYFFKKKLFLHTAYYGVRYNREEELSLTHLTYGLFCSVSVMAMVFIQGFGIFASWRGPRTDACYRSCDYAVF